MSKQALTWDVRNSAKDLMQSESVLDLSQWNLIVSDFGSIILAEGEQLGLDDENFNKPNFAPNGFGWRIILMRVRNGIAPPNQYEHGVRQYEFYSRVDVFPPSDVFDNEFFLECAHQRIYQIIDGQKVNIKAAEQIYKFERQQHPTPMYTDENKGFRYMTSHYHTVLAPEYKP